MRASQETISYTSKQCNSNRIAGWNEHLSKAKHKSISYIWHSIWNKFALSRNAHIAVMRRAGSRYHTAFHCFNVIQILRNIATTLPGN